MASQQQFSGRTVAGRYQLGPRRGSGLDAAVFDAFDLRDQQVVSLKVVHPDICANKAFAEAFDETMAKAAALNEPHLSHILDWGSDRWNQHEARFVTVEQLTGGSLRDVLDRGLVLSPSQTLSIGLDVLRALDVVHRGGLVHGDVRPSTIVFGSDRVPRLIDVGLGQLLGQVLWADALHVSNDRAMYVAPEVASRHEIVPKSDVYSLCLTMLECVTGRVPFVGDSTVATLSNRMNKLLPVSADLGPLAAVLEHAGRPDTQGRSSVAEFGQALVRTAERLPRPAPIAVPGTGLFDLDEAEATRQLQRPARSRSGSAAAAALAGGAAGAAASAASADPILGGRIDAPAVGSALAAGVPTSNGSGDGAATADVATSAVAPAGAGASDVATTVAAGAGAADIAAPSPATEGDDPAPSPTADEPVPGPASDAGAADDAVTDAGQLSGSTDATGPTVLTPVTVDGFEAPAGAPEPLPPPNWSSAIDEPTAAWPATEASQAASIVDEPASVAAAVDPPTLEATQAIPVTAPPPDPTRLMPSVARVPDRAGGGGPPSTPTLYDEPLPAPARRRRSFLWWLIPVILVLAAAGGAVAWYVNRTVAHTVPDLAGQSEGAALNQVSGLGWKTLTPQEANETVGNGMVIRTDPAAGVKLDEGKTLTIVVSTGPAPRTLPELKGMSLQQATDTLTQLGLSVVQGDPVFDDTIPSGSVVSWTVPDQPNLVAGNTVTKGVTVRVQVSKGPAPRLPDVTGKTLQEATAVLQAQQLQISQGAPAFDETVAAGLVVSWSVPGHPELAAGAVVDPGTTVQVILSNGPGPRTVPSLGGAAPAAAKAAVEGLQLVYAQGADDFSDTVPAGVVLRQDPAAGTQVQRGSTVTVVLSKGPDVVPMPTVVNLALQQAQDALAGAGLSVGTVTGNAAGVVTAATVNNAPVNPGQTLHRGTAVDLTLT